MSAHAKKQTTTTTTKNVRDENKSELCC